MLRLAVEFGGVGISISQHIAGELYHHHLHTEADTESRQVLFAAIASGNKFSFRATLSESRTNHIACHSLKHLSHILIGDVLRVDEMATHLAVIVNTSLLKCLNDGFISILQIILTHQTDVQFFCGIVATIEEGAPRAKTWCFTNGHTQLFKNHAVNALILHTHRHLINGGHIRTLEHGIGTHITEVCHLLAKSSIEFVFSAEHQDVRLNTFALQLLHRVLRRFGFEFSCSSQIRNIGEVDANGILTQFPFELSDGFHERQALDVTNRSAYFSDDKIITAFFAEIKHIALDFVGDVRHHLDCFTQIVATAFFVNHTLVDATGSEIVVARSFDACETLIVTEVKVCFLPIIGDITFAVFIGVERTWVDVDVRIKLLNRDVKAARLEQLTNRTSNDAFTERRGNTTCDKDIFGFSHRMNMILR